MSVDIAILPFEGNLNHFHPSQRARLDPARIPHHIAIIPDGNRRWAKKRLSRPEEGHREGADTLMDIVKAAKELGVKEMTFYAFSTENWSRPPEEVKALMSLFASYLVEQREEMVQCGVRLHTIGNREPLPDFLANVIADSQAATRSCKDISLILALNYGSRNELCRAFKAILKDYDQKILSKEDINEKTISCYLDTKKFKDPDLLIRTSGELRISNFLSWQISYAEIHVAPVLWPDFTPQHLFEALLDYQNRNRRWGGA